MKKNTALLMLFLCVIAYGQRVRFEYDVAGNQIVRKWGYFSPRIDNYAYKDTSLIEESDLQKFFPDDVISYYPNPVKEELYIKWQLINQNRVTSIVVFTLNGQILKTYEDNFNTNSKVVSFLEYPNGIYFVNLNYSNGDQKSIKIVKN